MNIKEAILDRHSVRHYVDKPLEIEAVAAIEAAISMFNGLSGLHIQLVQNEIKAFSRGLAYGKFSGVSNYLVIAAKPDKNIDETIGYYGEKIILLAQTFGINSCWAGLTYSKVEEAYSLNEGEKVVCMIALGHGKTQGVQHKSKPVEKVSNLSSSSPEWFRNGIEAALLAPTAVNQQKFRIEWMGGNQVRATTGFSPFGYTKMDLGIVKCHFEIGAENADLEWI